MVQKALLAIWMLGFLFPARGFPFDRTCSQLPFVDHEPSLAGIAQIDGPEIAIWSDVYSASKPDGSLQLEIKPDKPIVIGRSNGVPPPYLAAGYMSTPMIPQGGTVLKGAQSDCMLSRAHFMLKHHGGGILMVNGVPAKWGELRPPTFGTRLLEPENREMLPGEEYLIENGSFAKFLFPNGTVLLIAASEPSRG